jgi:hypothetical protein
MLSHRKGVSEISMHEQMGTDEVDMGVGVEQEAAVDYATDYVPVRCRCGSTDCPTYARKLPVRYHWCRACGLRFKSVEK